MPNLCAGIDSLIPSLVLSSTPIRPRGVKQMRLDCQTGSKTSLPGPGTQKVVERGAKEGEDISGAPHLSMPLSPTIPLFCCGLFQERWTTV